jgi:hypothetical protein
MFLCHCIHICHSSQTAQGKNILAGFTGRNAAIPFIPANLPTPLWQRSLKTGALYAAIEQLSAAGPDLYLSKRQGNLFSLQQT